jgi:2,4-dienoyl-CoA reductase (NADPH2)
LKLLEPLSLGGRTAPNRLLFGPHETNLGERRAVSDRHVAYYRRRAAGGAGVVVVEEASVHESDWPYERCPLAADCGPGWRRVADAVHGEGTGALVLAGLGHAGGQGSSAYSQAPLWAPSRVPEVNSREVPKWMEPADIAAVVEGFGSAARLATESGLDGVEVNAGQFSLVRQFLSGLTNHRGDQWGTDRLTFARDVLAAVRSGAGADAVVGLRLSCDELAPWAGLTPELAADVAVALAPLVDYLVVVRGSIFTASATRPDMHDAPGFNIELCRAIRSAVRSAGSEIPVVLQGSVVDPGQAEWALGDGVCDAVEMTRAQIADPALGRKLGQGVSEQVRPCVLCNQLCQVRDARNPIVSCIGEPASGHELDDPSPVPDGPAGPGPASGRLVFVVGGGPAGLEAARVAALRGHSVLLLEASGRLGGGAAVAATALGRERLVELVRWLEAECRRLGVVIELGHVATVEELALASSEGAAVVLATGSVDGAPSYSVDDAARVAYTEPWNFLSSLDAWLDRAAEGAVVVLDPIGGPIGVSLAETVAARGREAHLVTQDNIAGNELARTGDLAPANVRLQQAGVHIERRSIVRAVRATSAPAGATTPGAAVGVEVEDRFSGARRTIPAGLVVDAGFFLPDETLWNQSGGVHQRAGDTVAPRTVHEAVLEGRRAVVAVEARQP